MLQHDEPAQVVQRQLDAYNARDIEAFLAVFADDAGLFDLGNPSPTTVGKAAIRARYQALFDASPKLHSVVINRTAFGAVVVDLEQITGRNGGDAVMELMMIFEVRDGLIRRAHAVRNS
jgi:uncharacterized protein (TIGR02246 family)